MNSVSDLSGSCEDEMMSFTSIESIVPCRMNYLNKEIECEMVKLREELLQSRLDSSKRYKVDAVNRFLNSTRKSFHASAESLLSEHRRTSTPKLEKRNCARDKYKNSNLSSAFDCSSETNTEKFRKQINYHLERIQSQVEADDKGCGIYTESKSSSKVTTLKADDQKSSSPNTSYGSLSEQFKDAIVNLDTYKKKILKQKATIQLLTEQLEKEEMKRRQSLTLTSDTNQQSSQLKTMEKQLNMEKEERMKIMKEYTDIQQNFKEVEEERSQLVFTLTDLKTEARSILTAYEEAAQCIPEMKSLLEQSAKQKAEFSHHIKVMKKKAEEYNNKILTLEEKIKIHETINQRTELEKQELNNKFEEVQEKYCGAEKELQSANQLLLKVKESFSEMENSREDLKEKALNTLKMYRSKCDMYEQKMNRSEQQYKLKEMELSKTLIRSEELEISNRKHKEELEDISNKMDGINVALKIAVAKCEKLDVELSTSHDGVKEFRTVKDERDKLLKENTNLHLQLIDNNKKLSHLESVHLSLKEESSMLQETIEKQKSQIQEEHEKRAQDVAGIKKQCELDSQNEINTLKNNIEDLRKQLKLSENSAREVDNVKQDLEQQKALTNDEIEKSKILMQTWRLLNSRNQKIRDDQEIQKQVFDEKLMSVENSTFVSEEQLMMMQDEIDNMKKANLTISRNFKATIEIISKDSEDLLNLLWYEKEGMNPVKELPEHLLTDHQDEIVELRKKLQSCFSVTKALKEKYNNQKVLIGRARDRIKSQIKVIDDLKHSNNEENAKHLEQISQLETKQINNEEVVAQMRAENENLESHINAITEDLQVCTRALHTIASVELARDREITQVGVLSVEHESPPMKIEGYVVDSEQTLTEGVGETKSFNDVKHKVHHGKTEYKDRIIETFQSMSPATRRNLYKFVYDSPIKTYNKCVVSECPPPPSPFMGSFESKSSESNSSFVLVR